MPPMLLQIIAILLLCLAGAGCLLHVYATARLARFLRSAPLPNRGTAPLTFWRALKPGLDELDEKLDALASASRPEDQLLVGIDRTSRELEACFRWKTRHPGRDIHFVQCE